MNGDLISREALLKEFKSHISAAENARDFRAADAWRGALWDVQDAPAVDAEPVVHGRWIYKGYITTAYGSIETGCCPVCGAVDVPIEPYDYRCPVCGAKMDLEE
jgi:hypothetical protein